MIAGRWIPWAVPVLAEAAALARSVTFAWMLGAEQLGQAMMLALVVRLAEMASDLGIDRLILQAQDGNTARLQAELQGVAVIRGTVGALGLLALAPILAMILTDGPEATTYAVLAIIPFLRGLTHLDFRRAERRFRYYSLAAVEGGATLIMAACILPAAALLNDHRAMALVLIMHAVAHVSLSHLLASRTYHLQLSRKAISRVWRFGAPLILNAGLLFLTFYADRLIVAWSYDWATLAVYGVVLQLALLPAQVIGRAAGSLVLPRLRDALRRGTLSSIWQPVLVTHVSLSVAIAVGFAVLAPMVVPLIYGPDVHPDLALAIAVGVAAGFRILRTPYSQLAIATGRTGDPARANLMRAAALIPAAAFAAIGLPLAAIGTAAAVGEAAATLRAMSLAKLSFTTPISNEAYS